MTTHEHPLILLAAGGLALQGLHKWVDLIQPFLSGLVSVGQVAVALATVIYIARKTQILSKIKIKKRKPK